MTLRRIEVRTALAETTLIEGTSVSQIFRVIDDVCKHIPDGAGCTNFSRCDGKQQFHSAS